MLWQAEVPYCLHIDAGLALQKPAACARHTPFPTTRRAAGVKGAPGGGPGSQPTHAIWPAQLHPQGVHLLPGIMSWGGCCHTGVAAQRAARSEVRSPHRRQCQQVARAVGQSVMIAPGIKANAGPPLPNKHAHMCAPVLQARCILPSRQRLSRQRNMPVSCVCACDGSWSGASQWVAAPPAHPPPTTSGVYVCSPNLTATVPPRYSTASKTTRGSPRPTERGPSRHSFPCFQWHATRSRPRPVRLP